MSRTLSRTSDPDDATTSLAGWMRAYQNIFVLTGAGISTASGIPDYRGPDGQWKRRAPITYQAFLRDAAMRARYWARSMTGWPLLRDAKPNIGHAALVRIEATGRLGMVVTQNVDNLHRQAGQRNLIDLHGRIDQVMCLRCSTRFARTEIQHRLIQANPNWQRIEASIAPDGDADIETIDLSDFRVPACTACQGMLKPDVVFFGENVPRQRVIDAHAALFGADAMLVVGSSLMVYSGYRFARMASDRGLPLAIVTRGVTRADDLATLRLDVDCCPMLDAVANLFDNMTSAASRNSIDSGDPILQTLASNG